MPRQKSFNDIQAQASRIYHGLSGIGVGQPTNYSSNGIAYPDMEVMPKSRQRAAERVGNIVERYSENLIKANKDIKAPYVDNESLNRIKKAKSTKYDRSVYAGSSITLKSKGLGGAS